MEKMGAGACQCFRKFEQRTACSFGRRSWEGAGKQG